MPILPTRQSHDPLDDIALEASGVDSLMARQDRADLPDQRSDLPNPSASRLEANDDAAAPLEGLEDAEVVSLDEDPDIDMARDSLGVHSPGLGPDDDEPIEETERLGDDSIA